MMPWIVVGAVVWTAIAVPVGIVIGRGMKIADERAPERAERRHLYLVAT